MESMDMGLIVLNLVARGLPWTQFGLMGIMEKICGRDMVGFLTYGTATNNNMEGFWETGAPRFILLTAILAILVTIAYYAIEKTRPKPAQKERKAHQLLAKFREMHSQGELSDEEFRTIKTTLAAQLQDELNDNGEEG
jgi:uncharacterized membrane protein